MTGITGEQRGSQAVKADLSTADLETLEQIQRRVLWLATLIVHYANHVRPNLDKNKVGGHQASSASMVTILVALYFRFLKAADRVSVKPHASPAYHAIQYLLGNLDRAYLTELRAFKGLQAYPSRTKDPDPVDFSTGSVGLGVTATAFAALAHRYDLDHFGQVNSNRFVALVGDAELDEGSVWEAVNEEALRGLGNVLWIVDLNRQSLDRVIPGIKAARLKAQFEVNGWSVLEAKYGTRLQAVFNRPGGEILRQRIDEMSNEEYQSLLGIRAGATLRAKLVAGNKALEKLLADIPDADLPELYSNLGGHDLPELLRVFEEADAVSDRPVVVFAYTIKGWGLPIAGDRLNHSSLLTPAQIEDLRVALAIPKDHEWQRFAPDTAAGELCQRVQERLYPIQPTKLEPPSNVLIAKIPNELKVRQMAQASSQEAFGQVLRQLADLPEVGARIVTASPDVSISTNLAGWINKVGVYHHLEGADLDEGYTEQLTRMKWRVDVNGRHIELGISEMNLFMLLGMLGLSHELSGQLLLPIGTVYDPFICRGLDALIYTLYSGARFIFAGTPAGITLSPEGGAHQSTITPSIGLELPGLLSYEPCFAAEVEWIMLEALKGCADHTAEGYSTYLRLSTRPMEQSLLDEASARLGTAELRRQVLAGGYRLVDYKVDAPQLDSRYVVQIATCGALVPEAVEAARLLQREGVAANVLNLTSPQRLYQGWQRIRQQDIKGLGRPGSRDNASDFQLARLIPPEERRAPLVTVHDAASHALSWLGSVYGAPQIALGVDDFGQSGSRDDLYRAFDIDAESIANAAFTLLDLTLAEVE